MTGKIGSKRFNKIWVISYNLKVTKKNTLNRTNIIISSFFRVIICGRHHLNVLILQPKQPSLHGEESASGSQMATVHFSCCFPTVAVTESNANPKKSSKIFITILFLKMLTLIWKTIKPFIGMINGTSIDHEIYWMIVRTHIVIHGIPKFINFFGIGTIDNFTTYWSEIKFISGWISSSMGSIKPIYLNKIF